MCAYKTKLPVSQCVKQAMNIGTLYKSAPAGALVVGFVLVPVGFR